MYLKNPKTHESKEPCKLRHSPQIHPMKVRILFSHTFPLEYTTPFQSWMVHDLLPSCHNRQIGKICLLSLLQFGLTRFWFSKGLYNVHFACPTNAFDTYGISISY